MVGDVCLSRRKNKGEHLVMPLHASIQEHFAASVCKTIGTSGIVFKNQVRTLMATRFNSLAMIEVGSSAFKIGEMGMRRRPRVTQGEQSSKAP